MQILACISSRKHDGNDDDDNKDVDDDDCGYHDERDYTEL
jgi:hypothetical protein